ncbi:acyl-CoA carboxylase subunit epsilon [Microbacterium sp. EYE_5]|uniref:acyl-CoA carboxylase subunit epsilon n=1 Tax=unclassified Microbacterium TaxID=2609290 RepID=UPI002004F814|nr:MULTISPECIES: acyl-CoA carboxylase subunit epsilon [unclassified Microbacterium]MCK6081534.1 acyl-CoA carboxylase subunit epsilon [Microbacterium sp. EYE_382]MCK6086804.1 acyl-CoA carboxylase subunit epsilon [Microbacterium sp. EYE_384]MCK6123698.1 acyl-CoA carboxylase subunit epsilon [Microbacterium sp. EYE_80]MCK6126607.1 acyl-CoA carboxylase subunit epsilon [Microbacterium sp. EYE_79]MCK6142488.1 acyl-CoA carboxylase subunit epsilon [Microbacterium sp. EYE_39]
MSDEGDASGAVHLEVRRGDATPEELAAVIAVVSESYAREVTTAVAEDAPVSAWARSARGVRGPLRRDVRWGRWAG